MNPLDPETVAKLEALAKANVNTLLTGGHGIGKTSLFYQICKNLGLRGCYVNCPQTDYFVDWVGIPAPNREPDSIRGIRSFISQGNYELAQLLAKSMFNCDDATAYAVCLHLYNTPASDHLDFLRPERMAGVEFIFFDEINRGDDRFLNSCMELVQYRRINGQVLPDLKLVWAAQNPPNSIYKVKELDIPLTDKFGAQVTITGYLNYDYFVEAGINPATVTAVIAWYKEDLSATNREQVSNRKLENIMRLHDAGIDPEFALLKSCGISGAMLKSRLRGLHTGHQLTDLTLQKIAADPVSHSSLAKTNPDFGAYFTDLALQATNTDLEHVIGCCLVILNLLPDYKTKLLSDRAWVVKFQKRLSRQHGKESIPGYSNLVDMINRAAGGMP